MSVWFLCRFFSLTRGAALYIQRRDVCWCLSPEARQKRQLEAELEETSVEVSEIMGISWESDGSIWEYDGSLMGTSGPAVFDGVIGGRNIATLKIFDGKLKAWWFKKYTWIYDDFVSFPNGKSTMGNVLLCWEGSANRRSFPSIPSQWGFWMNHDPKSSIVG